MHMKFVVFFVLGASAALAEDASAIMAQVAANVEKAVDLRRQYVYQQTVRASLARTNGQFARREKCQYLAIPSATGTEKKFVCFVEREPLAFALVRKLRQTFIHKFNAAAIEKFPAAGCSHQYRPTAVIRNSYDSTRRNDVPPDSRIGAAL